MRDTSDDPHDDLCIHELMRGTCSACTPTGTPSSECDHDTRWCGRCLPPDVDLVFVTDHGERFHRHEDCQALLDGQERARRKGARTRPPQQRYAADLVDDDAMDACSYCFGPDDPTSGAGRTAYNR